MKMLGLYLLAGFITVALTAPPCHANNLEILLHSANNNTSETAQPSKDANPERQVNDAVVDVVVTEMTLLRSFFLMFSPEPKEAEADSPEASSGR